jgi:hypothetical protein
MNQPIEAECLGDRDRPLDAASQRPEDYLTIEIMGLTAAMIGQNIGRELLKIGQ